MIQGNVVPGPNEAVYVGQRSKKVVNKESIEAMKPEEDKMVSGMFKNLEQPGMDGYVACRYRKGPIFSRKFFDGEVCQIPLSVARHINQRCNWPRHKYELDKDGNHVKTVGQVVQRYQFVSTEYM